MTRLRPMPSPTVPKRRLQSASRLSGADRICIRSAHDQQTAAVAGRRWVGALVEQNRVVLDAAIPDESQLRNASAITGAQVAAHPVVVELVVVGAGAEGDAARSRRSSREQFIALGRVRRDRVVVHVHVRLKQYGSCSIRGNVAVLAGTRSPGLRAAPRDRPAGCSPWPIVMPPASVPWLLLTRLLEISRLCAQPWTKMPPPPWELLVTDKPSIRDGLHWKLLGNGLCAVTWSRSAPLPQLASVGQERWCRLGSCRLGASVERIVLRELVLPWHYRDSRAFICSHQCWLLQLFRQVAVQRGIPADSGFERQAVHLWLFGP